MNTPSPPILTELVRLLVKNVRTSALPYSILAIGLYGLLFSDHDLYKLNIWLVFALSVQAISFAYTYWCTKRGVTQQSCKPIIGGMAVLSVLQGAAWASLVWLTIESADHISNILIITIVGAFLSVFMLSMAPIWPLSVLFGTVATTVAAFKFIAAGNNYPAISLAGIPYVAALAFLSRNSYLTIKNAIELQFQNLSLIEDLRIETENAVLANKKAQEASHAKSHFLASASHDLRQPLYALSLLLESLYRTHPTPKQAKLMEKSLSAA